MSEINGSISAVEQLTGNLYPKGEKRKWYKRNKENKHRRIN